MPRPRSPYLHKEFTRHGEIAWYVRAGKGPRTRINGEYGSDEFSAAYRAAIAGEALPSAEEGQKRKAKIGTSPTASGYIYFVGAGHHVKIGFAKNVSSRMAELQVSHHDTLTLLHVETGTMRDEARLHAKFAKLRCRGEWFLRDGELAEYIGRAPAPDIGRQCIL